jgi:hypothetical protein
LRPTTSTARPATAGFLLLHRDAAWRHIIARRCVIWMTAPGLAPHEVVWRYYWMGGSVIVALAAAPGMIEPPDGSVGLVDQQLHDAD